MTIGDSQSTAKWFTIIKLNISTTNCPGNDSCVLSLNLRSFGNRKYQSSKENSSLHSTQHLDVRNRAARFTDVY